MTPLPSSATACTTMRQYTTFAESFAGMSAVGSRLRTEEDILPRRPKHRTASTGMKVSIAHARCLLSPRWKSQWIQRACGPSGERVIKDRYARGCHPDNGSFPVGLRHRSVWIVRRHPLRCVRPELQTLQSRTICWSLPGSDNPSRPASSPLRHNGHLRPFHSLINGSRDSLFQVSRKTSNDALCFTNDHMIRFEIFG